MNKIPYYKLPELENFYFEDSYVLDVQQRNKNIVFLLETVLTENHPDYHLPLQNEQYCYKKIKLCFVNAKKIVWIEKTSKSNIDINGEIDYGNIDVFYRSQNYFYLDGEWGKIKIIEASILIKSLD